MLVVVFVPFQLHHLILADADVDREMNLKLAVDFLIKSSKTGNEEATQKLKKCLQDETGNNCIMKFRDRLFGYGLLSSPY